MNRDSAKQRFEIDGDRIRALYGHSLSGQIVHTPALPPPVLFHGTSEETVRSIMREGLQPMRRQYVHLSTDPVTARQVGKRKRGTTVVLEVDAREAHRNGINFYHGNEDTWLSDAIPPRYVRGRRSENGSA